MVQAVPVVWPCVHEPTSIHMSHFEGCVCLCVCVGQGGNTDPPSPVSVSLSVAMCLDISVSMSFMSPSWRWQWCVCVLTFWCASLFIGGGVPSICPLLSTEDSGLWLQQAQAAPASAPPSRPGFRCFFQKEIFPRRPSPSPTEPFPARAPLLQAHSCSIIY